MPKYLCLSPRISFQYKHILNYLLSAWNIAFLCGLFLFMVCHEFICTLPYGIGMGHQSYYLMMLVNYIYWTRAKVNPSKMPNMIRYIQH